MDFEFPAETEEFLRRLFRGAIYNARRLADDAVATFKAGTYPTAQFLAMTSMEETARTVKLRTPFVMPQSEAELEEALKAMAEIFERFEDRRFTALEIAPYVPAYNAWEMSVDSISRVTERWGADVLTSSRISITKRGLSDSPMRSVHARRRITSSARPSCSWPSTPTRPLIRSPWCRRSPKTFPSRSTSGRALRRPSRPLWTSSPSNPKQRER